MMTKFINAFLAIVLVHMALQADECMEPAIECEDLNIDQEACTVYKGGLRVVVGPEVYRVLRRREGGTKQSGWLVGGHLLADHLRRYTFYAGVEGAYARGSIKGHLGNQVSIKSHMMNGWVEGRFGYTFGSKSDRRYMFTPFIGYGYVWEDNNFCRPSPLNLHFRTKYRYATAGLLFSFNACSCVNLGLNLKVRYLIEPSCRTSHDPDYSSASLNIGNDSIQYRVELPITYVYGCDWLVVALPFYERRSYGRQLGYPFDFLRTHLITYGTSIMIGKTF